MSKIPKEMIIMNLKIILMVTLYFRDKLLLNYKTLRTKSQSHIGISISLLFSYGWGSLIVSHTEIGFMHK